MVSSYTSSEEVIVSRLLILRISGGGVMEIKTGLPDNTMMYTLHSENFLGMVYNLRDIVPYVDISHLCSVLNLINNQGITDVSLQDLTYKWNGITYGLVSMGTAEQMFLISYLAYVSSTPLQITDYADELSPHAAKTYMNIFKGSNIHVYIKNTHSAFYVMWKRGDKQCLQLS